MRLNAIQYIILIVLVRLLWHLFQPIGMAGDETYYWLWGHYPDWGYYSKPPMIGWLYAFLGPLAGNTTFIYKAFTTLLGGGTLFFFYKTLKLLTGDPKLAYKALVAFSLLPAQLLISSFLTVDSPLLFAWTGASYFFARLICNETTSKSDYFCLFAFLAIGHLSKQMMLVQLPLIFLISSIYKPTLLKKPALWISSIGSLSALLPAIIWNAKNQWITFEHTAHHFEEAPFGLIPFISRLGELYGSLFLLFSPIFFILIFKSVPSLKAIKADRALGFYALWGLIGFTIISLMTSRQSINANWPACFLPSLIALIFIHAKNRSPNYTRWLTLGTWLSGSLSLVIMVFLLMLNTLTGPLAEMGITKPQRRAWIGYPELVDKIKNAVPEAEQIIGDGHRFVLSQIAYLGHYEKNAYQWNQSGKIMNQFDFFGTPSLEKKTAIITERSNAEDLGTVPEKLEALCESIRFVDEFQMHPSREFPRYKIYFVEKLNHYKVNP